MNKLYKLSALSYSTGGLATFFYVNHNLRKTMKSSTNQSKFFVFYSSLSHGTYWPLYWSYRHIYKKNPV